MINNFHTHTFLCKHADGKAIDYALQAAEDGCSALGFSDHCPYPDGVWPDSRMEVDEIPFYKEMVEEARRAVDFPVYFGFECEWDPRYYSWYKDYLIDEVGAEYLVFGSHWYPMDGKFLYINNIRDKKIIGKYIDFTIQGMQSGLYKFLAHPDLFLASVEDVDKDYQACAEALIDAAIDLHMPLEINGYGLLKNTVQRTYGEDYGYPVKPFWEMARDKGAIIICNSDAHFPSHTISSCKKAFDYAEHLHIQPHDAAQVLNFSYA
ncbi:PHP domain-containing protein [Treponema phagedenis]|uniref:Histidinol-phosphatase n=1 Tax=Treponema phagedenis TaxID=162 RepID=A0A0B7GW58_TREPH|nr:PHP domain-containing protein [Treponema phagedenis]QEJ94586.1 PHP domain-containing protein [Treponema phagedenis]QEJ98593.1 PHP domain-containing protein [Treponema phagedenis]QEK01535.1 PHP domain-containing protein [Treponema phagedenis]QEK04098.1 PHP domain-containing protein [Treponema phagedenis]QEK06622.1 PHP domain-containing protein [Treponema phagedenis]